MKNAASQSLPDSWSVTTIGEVADLNPPGSTVSAADDQMVTFLPMAAVEELTGRVNLEARRPFGEVKKGFTRFRDGDLLFAKITPSMENGKIAVVRDLAGGVGCGTTEFHVIRAKSGICADYLRYFVLRSTFRQEAKRNMQGAVGQQRVPADFICASELPLAPSAEQKRIVSKIDELFSEIGEGERALKRVQKLIERYRQSVLKAAATGELTREWRERHKGRLESGDVLLARILKARRVAWEKAELDKMNAQGIEPANDKWKQEYQEPSPPDVTGLPNLPNEWVWASLDQLAAPVDRAIQSGPFGSSLLHSEFRSIGKLVIGIDNVRDGWFSAGSQNRISDEKFDRLKKYAARPKDFLITVMATVGRTCVVPKDIEPAIITKHVYRFTLNQNIVLPEFVNLCAMGSPSVRSQIFGNVQGQTRPGLNKSILIHFGFPLPPIEEQRAILDRSTELLSQISPNEASIKSQKRLSESLRHAVLKSAFRGSLVQQDSMDEPASDLLERIAAERTPVISSRRRDKTMKVPVA